MSRLPRVTETEVLTEEAFKRSPAGSDWPGGDVNKNLMGTYTSPAGANNTAQAQWIFPGKVFKNDPQGKIEPMARNAVTAQEPLAVIAQMKQWASAIVGSGPGTLGANPGASGDMRTPAGVAAISGGESVKLQDLIDVISEQIFVPFLEYCIEQNQKLKPSRFQQGGTTLIP